jgi:16S rRNA (guanine527-N7)-methyltransferase
MTDLADRDRSSAEQWLIGNLGVSRETLDKLALLTDLLIAANDHQNLIARSTVPDIWWRHVVDSAQLYQYADSGEGRWLDIGAGPGLPGLVLAIIGKHDIHMVESRRLRCTFMEEAISALNLPNAHVHQTRIEKFESSPFDVITARAFASLSDTLDVARRLSTENTQWVLPKGRSAAEELANLPSTWHKFFHVEQSVSSPDSGIIVGRLNQGERRRA